MTNNAIVTVQRTTPAGIVDIIVAFALRGGHWFFTHIMDEDGNEFVLTETEELLARGLVEAGIEEASDGSDA